jgi:hypothetical protein
MECWWVSEVANDFVGIFGCHHHSMKWIAFDPM